MMAAVALALFVVMMLLAGAVRTLIQRHRTGDSGNRRTLSPRGSLGWSALTATDIGYLMVGVAGPLAHWLGLPPMSVLQHPSVHVVGVALAVEHSSNQDANEQRMNCALGTRAFPWTGLGSFPCTTRVALVYRRGTH
ncbi:hypothetical protein [Mycolicibacterium grossiae]|uniref:hypothetical protein n=1 Tax=Mycolicibacterium grossiae TaxID=1552759 RepID=UPI000AD3A9B5|nr:hypothetical protein [Mycolicibacterium grossiae]